MKKEFLCSCGGAAWQDWPCDCCVALQGMVQSRHVAKIVTRHAGAIRWLASRGIRGEVIPHLDIETIEKGDRIFGVLPLNIIREALARGAEVHLVTLPTLAFKERGQELSPKKMEEAGARLTRCTPVSFDVTGANAETPAGWDRNHWTITFRVIRPFAGACDGAIGNWDGKHPNCCGNCT